MIYLPTFNSYVGQLTGVMRALQGNEALSTSLNALRTNLAVYRNDPQLTESVQALDAVLSQDEFDTEQVLTAVRAAFQKIEPLYQRVTSLYSTSLVKELRGRLGIKTKEDEPPSSRFRTTGEFAAIGAEHMQAKKVQERTFESLPQETKQLFREIIEGLTVQGGVYDFKKDGRAYSLYLEMVNKKIEEESGFTEEFLKGIDILEQVKRSGQDAFLFTLDALRERGPQIFPPVRLVIADGSFREFEIHATRIEGCRFGIFYMVPVVQSELKRANEELAIKRPMIERYQKLLLSLEIPNSVLYHDAEGKLQVDQSSYSLAKLSGYSTVELNSSKLGVLFESDNKNVMREIETFIQSDPPQEDKYGRYRRWLDIPMRHKDGTTYPIDIVATIGGVAGALVTFVDARERQRKDAARREVETMFVWHEAADALAHDVNNGAQQIKMYIQLAIRFSDELAEALRQPSEEKRLMAVIEVKNSMLRLQAKLSDRETLEYAKTVAGIASAVTAEKSGFMRMAMEFTDQTKDAPERYRVSMIQTDQMGPLYLGMVLNSSWVYEHITISDVDVSVDLYDTKVFVRADGKAFSEMMTLLIVNACDAMAQRDEKKRRLDITVNELLLDQSDVNHLYNVINDLNAKPGAYIRINIADTGHGIPPELMRKIFDPRFTTHEDKPTSVTHDRGRMGMGLFRVRSIVNSLGGFIHVDSEVGVGSTFKIYLPKP